MQRKQFLINLCQRSWKRWTLSGWIWDSFVKLFFTWRSSNINDPQFWRACCEGRSSGECARHPCTLHGVWGENPGFTAPHRVTQSKAKRLCCFMWIWAKMVSRTYSFSRKCKIFKVLPTEKPSDTTLGKMLGRTTTPLLVFKLSLQKETTFQVR